MSCFGHADRFHILSTTWRITTVLYICLYLSFSCIVFTFHNSNIVYCLHYMPGLLTFTSSISIPILTVRPDWIWMRVVPLESPLKGHQPLYVFDFLISVLNIWNNFKVLSRFMQNWTQPPACSDHGLHRILSSYWLAHCYLIKKIPQSGALFWCGLRNDGCKPQPKRTIDASPAFMEYGLAKKIAAWAHENRDPNKQEDWIQFCMKRLRTLKSFKIFKSEIKKLKTYSGWCPFKGLFNDNTLMQIQSGRTVPLNKTICLAWDAMVYGYLSKLPVVENSVLPGPRQSPRVS